MGTSAIVNQGEPATTLSARRYLGVLLGVVALGLAALAAFNYFVDPFGAYRPGVTQGLDEYKDYDFRRLYVAELLRQNPCEVVFLGSSRAYMGIDPRWPEWGTAQAWNTGVPSAAMNEIGAIGGYALGHCPVKRVYLFADFFAFNDAVESHRDFERSRFSAGFNPVAYHLRNLITIDSTNQAVEVLRKRRAGKPAAAHVNGFMLRTYPAKYPQQRADIQRSLNFYLRSKTAFATFTSYRESIARLARLVRDCRARGVELTVVVLPVHALHLEAMRGAGLWEMFEDWEREVAAMLAAGGGAAGAEAFAFWDFSSYRGAAAEPVPAKVGMAPAMAYFRDDAHPLPGFVQLVARRITGQEVADPADGGAFGVRLTPENVEEHLRMLREEREVYAAGHPADVKWVEGLAKEAAKWNARGQSSKAAKQQSSKAANKTEQQSSR